MTKRYQKGFTLVEVVVAIVIVALVFTCALMLLTSGNNTLNRASNRNNLAIQEKSLLNEATYDTTYFLDTYKISTEDINTYRLNYSDSYQTLTDKETNHYIILTINTETKYDDNNNTLLYTTYTITLQGYLQGSKLNNSLEREVRVYA